MNAEVKDSEVNDLVSRSLIHCRAAQDRHGLINCPKVRFVLCTLERKGFRARSFLIGPF